MLIQIFIVLLLNLLKLKKDKLFDLWYSIADRKELIDVEVGGWKSSDFSSNFAKLKFYEIRNLD